MSKPKSPDPEQSTFDPLSVFDWEAPDANAESEFPEGKSMLQIIFEQEGKGPHLLRSIELDLLDLCAHSLERRNIRVMRVISGIKEFQRLEARMLKLMQKYSIPVADFGTEFEARFPAIKYPLNHLVRAHSELREFVHVVGKIKQTQEKGKFKKPNSNRWRAEARDSFSILATVILADLFPSMDLVVANIKIRQKLSKTDFFWPDETTKADRVDTRSSTLSGSQKSLGATLMNKMSTEYKGPDSVLAKGFESVNYSLPRVLAKYWRGVEAFRLTFYPDSGPLDRDRYLDLLSDPGAAPPV